MIYTIHRLAAILAALCMATFSVSTLLVELFGSEESIAMVKSLIVMPGLFILVPAMALTGATGAKIAKVRKGCLVEAKKKRMPIVAANGILILIPAALFLNHWASIGSFDTKFYIVQCIELLAGAVNLTLMGMNIRDGLKMAGRLRPKQLQQTS
ncbi:hypothetical protein [Spartinivicinus ruber]|uniref:hypothetical protein n=1 Tax=Spartinivicinus ruber TaxID=2683272 RepID=UPI0013D48472|nr:hypothetical protein [Spartinivicinus ruber]